MARGGGVDEFEIGGEADLELASAMRPVAIGGAGRPWAWVAGALALVTAGVMAVPATLPREPEVATRIFDMSDLVVGPDHRMLAGPVDGPLAPEWTADLPEPGMGVYDFAFSDDRVVVQSMAVGPGGKPGDVFLRGYHAADGTLVWEVRDPEPQFCALEGTPIMCVSTGSDEPVLTSVDPLTGEAIRTSAPGALAASSLDGDLLLLSTQPNGVSLTRYDGPGPSGGERWRIDLPNEADAAPGGVALGPPSHLQGTRRLVLGLAYGAMVLDTETGAILGQATYPGNADLTIPLALDDEPDSPIHLVQNGVGFEAQSGSGERLWVAPKESMPVARLGGYVVALSPLGLHGLEATTGAEVWRDSDAHVWWDGCYGYETTLICVAATLGEAPAVVALDTATGARLWSEPLPGRWGSGSIRNGDRVVVMTDSSLSMFTLPLAAP